MRFVIRIDGENDIIFNTSDADDKLHWHDNQWYLNKIKEAIEKKTGIPAAELIITTEFGKVIESSRSFSFAESPQSSPIILDGKREKMLIENDEITSFTTDKTVNTTTTNTVNTINPAKKQPPQHAQISSEFPDRLWFKKILSDEYFSVFIEKKYKLINLMKRLYTNDNIESVFTPGTHQISFGEKVYDSSKTLGEIHDEINLNSFQFYTFVETPIARAKNQLVLQTGLKWEVNSHDDIYLLECEQYFNDREELEDFKNIFLARVLPESKNMLSKFIVEESQVIGKQGGMEGNRGESESENIARGIFKISISDPVIIKKISEGLSSFDADNSDKKISEAKEHLKNNLKLKEFKKMEPIIIGNVRKSLGASVYALIGEKEKIANIEFSKEEGMIFNFLEEIPGNKENRCGKQVYSILETAGYKSISQGNISPTVDKFGSRNWYVQVKDLNEVKRIIENTFSYTDKATKDLFESVNIKNISHDFFIKELIDIGKSNVKDKKKKAKDFIDKFLPFLDKKEAQLLKKEIQEHAKDSNGTNGSELLRYLREERNFVTKSISSLLNKGSSYSDKASSYQYILEKVDEMIKLNVIEKESNDEVSMSNLKRKSD